MLSTLELSSEQLTQIALQFASKINDGLKADDQEIQCLPTFITPSSKPIEGNAYVLDLGGSNLRAGLVSIRDGQVTVMRESETLKMPWIRNHPFDKNRFLQIQADLLNSIAVKERLPLGYCFSYPTISMMGGDAILKHWTKDIDVPGTVGQKVGQLLLDFMGRNDSVAKCGRVTVINDTIASLLSGQSRWKSGWQVGLIVGTGFNIASHFKSRNVKKRPELSSSDEWIPINLEAGGFGFSRRTAWDIPTAGLPGNTGIYPIEWAVSGAYLGRLLKRVYPDCDLDPERGAVNLVQILNESESGFAKYTEGSLALYNRSARLVGACLAGLIKAIAEFGYFRETGQDSLNISAEGSLFWSEVHSAPLFREVTQQTLDSILGDIGLSQYTVRFQRVSQANFIGSATAALSNEV